MITIPRCLESSDRPGGITEETSIARICFDVAHPWYQGTLDFTRYVSFDDFAPFGSQMIPRTWTDDIPENIFLQGKVTTLEKLSARDLKSIHVSAPTPLNEQLRTVFLSRDAISNRIADVPDYAWPPDNGRIEGYMIVYVRTDRAGQIRESYWDSSDNYGLQDAGVLLALKSSLKPLLVDGAAVQMEGPLVLRFKTTHLDPSIPVETHEPTQNGMSPHKPSFQESGIFLVAKNTRGASGLAARRIERSPKADRVSCDDPMRRA